MTIDHDEHKPHPRRTCAVHHLEVRLEVRLEQFSLSWCVWGLEASLHPTACPI